MMMKIYFVFSVLLLFLGSEIVAQEPKPPEAITDYAETLHGGSVAINVLLNDFAEEGHPLEIVYCGSGGTLPFYGTAFCKDSMLFYQPFDNQSISGSFPLVDTIEYRIQDLVNMLFSEIGFCIITIDQPDFEGPRESLEMNNYTLPLTPFGNYFRDYFGNYLPMFFVPSNSQLSTIRDSYLVPPKTR
jgi:hypothetical protein